MTPRSIRSTAPVYGFILLVAMLLASGVLLARAGWETESIAGLLTAVAAAATGVQVALSKLATLDERTQAIEQRAEHIEERTDGVPATIQSAVHRAIDLRMSAPASPPGRRCPTCGGPGGRPTVELSRDDHPG